MAQEEFMEKFRTCFVGDDLDTSMQLMDEGAVWTFMATGETFKGREQIRGAAERAMAGRVHTEALHMEVKNFFASDDMASSISIAPPFQRTPRSPEAHHDAHQERQDLRVQRIHGPRDVGWSEEDSLHPVVNRSPLGPHTIVALLPSA